ncbi:hypothetical protein C8046_07260 [Serinibacter arcticus]|uniref:Secreted protein n=1 Tax=Serinibacter arcticus TaxID=1655435 RepID=A0A2U1ZU20_9MICO|nr:hypothetical protein [Serinibacter arcticus]PWD50479.1 hypothetical protein C8046_07260 [Serinibacter arcticus]
MRNGRTGLAAVAALAVLGAGGMASCQAEEDPISITEDTISTDVLVTASVRTTQDGIWWDYVLENTSSEAVWIVEPRGALVFADRSVAEGVALVAAMYPVRGDVDHAQAPATAVVELAPGETREGTGTAPRPLEPFSDREGDRPVRLPAEPATARICAGYVTSSQVEGAGGVRDLEDGTFSLGNAVGFPLQRLACSTTHPLT